MKLILGLLFAVSVTTFAQTETKDASAAQTVTVQTQSVAPTTTTTQIQTVAPQQSAPVQQTAPTVNNTDNLRKVRQEVEQKNDTKVLEKLEKTRLEEEKNLAEKIDSTNLKSNEQPTQQQQVQQTPVVKIERVEIVQPQQSQPTAVVNKSKSKAKKVVDEEEDEEKSPWYVGAGFGMGQYMTGNLSNKSNYGVTVGTLIDERVMLEGSLSVANYTLNNYWQSPVFGDLDQYDFGFTGKYILNNGEKFRPYVSGSVDYIYRVYKNRYNFGPIYNIYDNYTQSQSTNAFNLGIGVGADFFATKSIAIGGDIRYSFNFYRQGNGLVYQPNVYGNVRPLEESAFTTLMITGKYFF